MPTDRQVTKTSLRESKVVECTGTRQRSRDENAEMVMAEVEERIARLQQLLSTPEAEVDEAVLRHNLCQLRQLRAEMTLDSA